jgi:hypothetical protein
LPALFGGAEKEPDRTYKGLPEELYDGRLSSTVLFGAGVKFSRLARSAVGVFLCKVIAGISLLFYLTL